ncbi:MAG: DUF3501 family protein [Rhodospirillaceae bacterium]|nr:DUF3501 family protein [Rhodospirillaceae bacterium]
MNQEPTPRRKVNRADLMPIADYAKIRREHRRELVEAKRRRRVHIGPHVSLYFENFETMWAQIQEMLFIERGGEDQVEGELAAYNPLIPQGAELIATMMIEIEDEGLRRRTLASMGHIEDTVQLSFAGHTVKGVPEADIDRTTEEGKTSSVHFLNFAFTPEQIVAFKTSDAQVMAGIFHLHYGHMAVLAEECRAALAKDFV